MSCLETTSQLVGKDQRWALFVCLEGSRSDFVERSHGDTDVCGRMQTWSSTLAPSHHRLIPCKTSRCWFCGLLCNSLCFGPLFVFEPMATREKRPTEKSPWPTICLRAHGQGQLPIRAWFLKPNERWGQTLQTGQLIGSWPIKGVRDTDFFGFCDYPKTTIY